METRTEYIVRNKKEIEAEGIFFSESIAETLENEYYDEIIVKHIKAGGRIENNIYKDLTNGQQYHFNKFLNWDNDKVINSDYEQEIKRLKEISDKKHKIYLQEQEHIFHIGDSILYNNSQAKILDILESIGIFAEFDNPLMSNLGFETNRLWITNEILKANRPEYGIEQYGIRKDKPYIKLSFNLL